MTQVDDLSRCLATLDENSTLVAVVEMEPIELADSRAGSPASTGGR